MEAFVVTQLNQCALTCGANLRVSLLGECERVLR